MAIKILIGPIGLVVKAIKWLRDNWDDLVAGVGAAVDRIVAHVQWIYDGVVRVFTNVWDFVTSIPQRMYDAGVNIITSIRDGIVSAAESVIEPIVSVVEEITSYLPFSPRKERPAEEHHEGQDYRVRGGKRWTRPQW